MSEWPYWVWIIIVGFVAIAIAEGMRKSRQRQANDIEARRVIEEERQRKARGKVA